MTASRSKDNPDKPRASDKLLTSQDLFGDIVDAPLEAPPEPAGPVDRKPPIRVQISEPVPGQPPRTVRPPDGPSEMREAAAAEVAALLDLFDGPPAAAPAAP